MHILTQTQSTSSFDVKSLKFALFSNSLEFSFLLFYVCWLYTGLISNTILCFQNAVRIKDGFDREIAIHHVVQQLPPPHYKTVEFLLKHLAKLADYHEETGMHAKNLSIVWAPNLMRIEKMEESSTLAHLGSQAVVVEFLIRNVDIFFDKDTAARAITKFPFTPRQGHRERSHSDPSSRFNVFHTDS